MAKKKLAEQAGTRNLSNANNAASSTKKRLKLQRTSKTATTGSVRNISRGFALKQKKYDTAKRVIGAEHKGTLAALGKLKKAGWDTFANPKKSSAFLTGLASKGNTVAKIFAPGSGKKIKVYTFTRSNAAAKGAMRMARVTANNKKGIVAHKNSLGGVNDMTVKLGLEMNRIKKGQSKWKYGGETNVNALTSSNAGGGVKKPRSGTIKPSAVTSGSKSTVGGNNTSNAMPNLETVTKGQWNKMTGGQKFRSIAKMSSPEFKAKGKFAKQKAQKAKNISRAIGIAGKAVGGIGRGISSGYSKGWNSR